MRRAGGARTSGQGRWISISQSRRHACPQLTVLEGGALDPIFHYSTHPVLKRVRTNAQACIHMIPMRPCPCPLSPSIFGSPPALLHARVPYRVSQHAHHSCQAIAWMIGACR